LLPVVLGRDQPQRQGVAVDGEHGRFGVPPAARADAVGEVLRPALHLYRALEHPVRLPGQLEGAAAGAVLAELDHCGLLALLHLDGEEVAAVTGPLPGPRGVRTEPGHLGGGGPRRRVVDPLAALRIGTAALPAGVGAVPGGAPPDVDTG